MHVANGYLKITKWVILNIFDIFSVPEIMIQNVSHLIAPKSMFTHIHVWNTQNLQMTLIVQFLAYFAIAQKQL